MLPGAAHDYDKADFARDIFFLDRSPVVATRSAGRPYHFQQVPARRARPPRFTFVAPNGEPVIYYGIKFSEVGS